MCLNPGYLLDFGRVSFVVVFVRRKNPKKIKPPWCQRQEAFFVLTDFFGNIFGAPYSGINHGISWLVF